MRDTFVLSTSIGEVLQLISDSPPSSDLMTLKTQEGEICLTRSSLEQMRAMALEHLPIQTLALPKAYADILSRPHQENRIKNVSNHLSDYFPNFFVAAIYELSSIFSAQSLKAYIIGGLIRDMLLSNERQFEIVDADITLEGQALHAAYLVGERSKNFHLIETFPNFGTAKLGYKDRIEFDFASTRRELYSSCGALPEVVEVGVPLEKDIIRRDFTINALALSISEPGSVIDCTGGLKDLQSRCLTILKPESFFEDPSRMIRALKYAVRLDFQWSQETQLLLEQALIFLPELYKGGGDRIKDELKEFFSLPESMVKQQWLHHFFEYHIYLLIDTRLPKHLKLPIEIEHLSARMMTIQKILGSYWDADLTWEIYLALFMLSMPEGYRANAMSRLGLTRFEIEIVEDSVHLIEDNTISHLKQSDDVCDLYTAFDSLSFAAACVGVILSDQMTACTEALLKFKRELEAVHLEVTGDDIIKLGVPQGARIGQLLRELHQAKLKGQVTQRSDELNWLKKHLTS